MTISTQTYRSPPRRHRPAKRNSHNGVKHTTCCLATRQGATRKPIPNHVFLDWLAVRRKFWIEKLPTAPRQSACPSRPPDSAGHGLARNARQIHDHPAPLVQDTLDLARWHPAGTTASPGNSRSSATVMWSSTRQRHARLVPLRLRRACELHRTWRLIETIRQPPVANNSSFEKMRPRRGGNLRHLFFQPSSGSVQRPACCCSL